MSAAGGGKSSGSGYQTAATTLGNQVANTIGSQTGITPGGAGMFGGILGNFGNNLGDAFASQPGQIPWNPRANRQPITTPEDQRELYDNAPPGVSIGGGPAPIGPGMPSPVMPGGKSSGPGGIFKPFNPRDFTTPFNLPTNQFTPQFGAGSQMTGPGGYEGEAGNAALPGPGEPGYIQDDDSFF